LKHPDRFRFLRGAPFGEEPDEEKVPVMRKEFDAKLAELEVRKGVQPLLSQLRRNPIV
jgi:hypothetical protein